MQSPRSNIDLVVFSLTFALTWTAWVPAFVWTDRDPVVCVSWRDAQAYIVWLIGKDVWQWTEDCYSDSYANAPTDGAAVTGHGCLRVDRGGSWLYPAWRLHSATRERNPEDFRDAIMGFRLAKTVESR